MKDFSPSLADGSPPDIYFVDMDGTLLSTSSEKYFLQRLVASGRLGVFRFLRFMGQYLLHPARTLREGKGWNRSYLRGMDEEIAAREAEECARRLLRDRVRPWTLASAREMAAGGTRTVLLSASLSYLAAAVGRELGFSTVRASRPETEGGRLTGRLTGIRPWGRDKVRVAERVCEEAGTALNRCAAAGDSWSDRFLLERCGLPIAVCPDRKLEKLARNRGWKIVRGKKVRWA